jgi:predicted PurR-regulated permease PerM
VTTHDDVAVPDPPAPPQVAELPEDRNAAVLRPRRPSPWADSFGRVAVRSAQVLLVLALVSALVIGLAQLKLVVTPVLITIIIAAAVSPVVGSLKRRGFPDALAAWIAMLTGLGALAIVIWLVVRGFRREWDELRIAAEDGFIELQRYLTGGPLGITEEQIEQARAAAVEFLTSSTVSSGAIAGAVVAAEVVAGIFLGLVILFFLLKDGQRIWNFLVRPLPAHTHERAHRIGDRAVETLGGYVRGTAIVALVDALVIGVALAILGVPLALPLATIVFLGAFIPLVGATLAGTIAALVALVANGPGTMLIVVIVVIAVNQLEGDLLAPIVLGRAVRLHALAILLALTAGTILAGILGALLSVPLTAVAWTVIREWRGTVEDEEPPRPHLTFRPKREKAVEA